MLISFLQRKACSKQFGRIQARNLVTFLMVAMIFAVSGGVEARRRHYHVHYYQPPSAAMAIDMYTGRILYSKNANEQRYPASLTKVMTLYLLFDALRDGKITMKTQMRVSAHAASQAPSSLDLQEGDSITVEDAIRAVVTKSANDVAVVIAEAIAGSEEEFARRMTQKARTLGMLNTTFRNASGLPNSEHRTSAQDLIIMGKSILLDHPEKAHYFSLKYFEYNGETFRNHNSMLFSYEGMEGMKTGFTNSAGFNLIAVAHRHDKRILAVVLGGPSSSARNAAMRGMLDAAWSKASTEMAARKAGILLAMPKANKPKEEPVKVAAAEQKHQNSAKTAETQHQTQTATSSVTSATAAKAAKPAKYATSQTRRQTPNMRISELRRLTEARLSHVRPRVHGAAAALLLTALEWDRGGQNSPILGAYEQDLSAAANTTTAQNDSGGHSRKRRHHKTVTSADMSTDEGEDDKGTTEPSSSASTETAAIEQKEETSFVEQAVNVSVHYKTSPVRTDGTMTSQTPAMYINANREPMKDASAPAVTTAIATVTPTKEEKDKDEPQTISAATAAVSKVLDQPEGPYHIQVGAFSDLAQAEERLKQVGETLGKSALKAHPKFTMPVAVASGTMFRARLGKFDEESDAKHACRKLKREDIECMVVKVD